MNKSLYVIIINYNGFSDTVECIESIMKSEFFDYSLVVVDNCSDDGSYERLVEYNKNKQFILLRSDFNGGFSYGNNIGIGYAMKQGCEHVLLLNNDTIVRPDFIDVFTEKVPDDIGIAGCLISYYDDKDKIWYGGGKYTKKLKAIHFFQGQYISPQIMNNTLHSTFITGCCMYISRDTINKIGYLDEDFFIYAEDLEYCIRADKNNIKMYCINDLLVCHKVSSYMKKLSFASQYYEIRNQLLILRKFNENIISYIYWMALFFYRMIKGKYSIRIMLKAIKDGICNITGKMNQS